MSQLIISSGLFLHDVFKIHKGKCSLVAINTEEGKLERLAAELGYGC